MQAGLLLENQEQNKARRARVSVSAAMSLGIWLTGNCDLAPGDAIRDADGLIVGTVESKPACDLSHT